MIFGGVLKVSCTIASQDLTQVRLGSLKRKEVGGYESRRAATRGESGGISAERGAVVALQCVGDRWRVCVGGDVCGRVAGIRRRVES